MSAPADAMPPPRLTAVVVVLAGAAALERCLRSLGDAPAETLVLGPSRRLPPPGALAPSLRLVPTDDAVPMLRARGVRESRGEWLLLVEDTCELAAGWERALAAAHGDDAIGGIGGPVAIAPGLSARATALGCVEYGEYAPDRIGTTPVPAERVAGVCMAFRRDAVAALATAGTLVEAEAFAALARAGYGLVLDPRLRVRYAVEDRDGATLRARRMHGRIYGGGLRELRTGARRWLALAKCFALPPVLYARAVRGLSRGGSGDVGHELATRAWILAFVIAWSIGEFTGLAFGRGRALAGWRS